MSRETRNGHMVRQTATVIGLAFLSSPVAYATAAPSDDFMAKQTAFDTAWDAEPLAISVATFVEAPATGYGLYTRKSEAVFKPGETMYVYTQPVAYDFREADGSYTYDLNADFKLLTRQGQILLTKENFTSFSETTHGRKHELSAAFSFAFEGLPDGSYTLQIDLSDKIGKTSSAVDLPFTISSGK